MKINLTKKPKKATMILGFPGIGLVGPIVTEFLIEHMKTEQIGTFEYTKLPATAAIHKGQLVHPMSLHYSKEHHTLIVYTILNVQGHEWSVAEHLRELAQELDVKEILCIDGANTVGDEQSQLYSYGSKKLLDLGAHPLQESVITGVTGALLLTEPKTTCLFAGTQANLPDSKAAATVVELLDKHLSLNVDYHPLIKQAEVFETKLKSMIDQSEKLIKEQRPKGQMDYLG